MNEFERERQVTLIKTYTYIVNCVLIFELKIKTEKSSNFTGIFNFILSIGFSHMSKFPTVSLGCALWVLGITSCQNSAVKPEINIVNDIGKLISLFL